MVKLLSELVAHVEGLGPEMAIVVRGAQRRGLLAMPRLAALSYHSAACDGRLEHSRRFAALAEPLVGVYGGAPHRRR